MRSNNTLEEELRKEIMKWTNKLDKALLGAAPSSDRGEKLLKNIQAYREDSKHFLERNDLIRSFECLIWAWALLELGKELDHLK
jgi:hypothetical protein